MDNQDAGANLGPGREAGPAWLDPARVLDAMGHAVIVTDATGTVVYLNRTARQLYGWSVEEARGRHIGHLVVPEMSQALAEEVITALHSGSPWSGAFTVRRKDGSTFAALVTDTAVYGDAGEMAGIVGVSLDLTQAVRPLLFRSTDAAIILARDERVTLVSPAGSRLFGWSEERALGQSFWDLVHPDDRDAARDYYGRALSVHDGIAPHECRVVRFPDGWCWAEVVFTNLLDDLTAGYVVGNLRDVTERREDREQLVTLTEQLQTALTSRVVIEQAKGIVAHSHGVSVDQAFELLRGHARGHNARLHDVASAVVNLGLEI